MAETVPLVGGRIRNEEVQHAYGSKQSRCVGAAVVLSLLGISAASVAMVHWTPTRISDDTTESIKYPASSFVTEQSNDNASKTSSPYTLFVEDEYRRIHGRAVGDDFYDDTIVQILKPTQFKLLDEDGQVLENVRWSFSGSPKVVNTKTSIYIEVVFDSVGDYEAVATTSSGSSTKFRVLGRIVRREIRDLTDADRSRYFEALHRLYTIGQKDGEAQYGPGFMSSDFILRKHLYGAAQRSCDHWHDDAGFVNHHVGITWEFERSLRMIDSSTASHYWDYTREKARGISWWESDMFGEDWFGPANPENEKHVIDVGRWAYTPVLREARTFSNITNPYGLLRSPWNTNPTAYLMRSSFVMGSFGDNQKHFPSCEQFRDTIEKAMDMKSLNFKLNGLLHGPVHLMLGGHWNTKNKDFLKYASQAGSPHNYLLMSKFLWRQGLIRVPSYCSADTPEDECMPMCPESIIGDRDAETVLRDYGLYNVTFDPPLVKSYTAEELLTELCHVGYPGEMFTSAAPQDPIFWPLHGNAERFLQLVRIMHSLGVISLDESWGYAHEKHVSSDTGVVCDWSEVDALEMPKCTKATCPGHREEDLLPFKDLAPSLPEFLTNRQMYDAIHPNSLVMPYVYDSLDYWQGCDGHSILSSSSLDHAVIVEEMEAKRKQSQRNSNEMREG